MAKTTKKSPPQDEEDALRTDGVVDAPQDPPDAKDDAEDFGDADAPEVPVADESPVKEEKPVAAESVTPQTKKDEVPKKLSAKDANKKVKVRNYEYRKGQITLREHGLVRLDDDGCATVTAVCAEALMKYFPGTELVK